MSEPRVLMDYLRLAADYLERSGSPSARLDAELLLGHVLGLDRVGLYVNHDRPLVPAEVDAYREALRARARGMPVAYITGTKEFLRTTLKVSPAVLVPRPETELLVEAVVRWFQAGGAPDGLAASSPGVAGEPKEAPPAGPDGLPGSAEHTGRPLLADVGTGSGAIAIGLALALPGARVLAVDISPEALAVARTNVAAHGLEERIVLLEGDLLEPVAGWCRDNGTGRLDAVVANPPYIPARDWDGLPRSVREYEPRVALDGGSDGLAVYRRLIPQAARLLRPGGLLALEIGHDQEAALRAMLGPGGPWEDVAVRRDYAGHPRVVLARRGREE